MDSPFNSPRDRGRGSAAIAAWTIYSIWSKDMREFDLGGYRFVGEFKDIDFSGSNMSYCQFGPSRFTRCNFTGVRLDYSDLKWCVVDDCVWTGALLKGTCLDPEHDYLQYWISDKGLSQKYGWVHNGFQGLRLYRTDKSIYYGNTNYTPGSIYVAPVLSHSPQKCHPGIYLSPLLDVLHDITLLHWDTFRVVECFVKAGDFYPMYDHDANELTARCKRIEVLRYVEDSEIDSIEVGYEVA